MSNTCKEVSLDEVYKWPSMRRRDGRPRTAYGRKLRADLMDNFESARILHGRDGKPVEMPELSALLGAAQDFVASATTHELCDGHALGMALITADYWEGWIADMIAEADEVCSLSDAPLPEPCSRGGQPLSVAWGIVHPVFCHYEDSDGIITFHYEMESVSPEIMEDLLAFRDAGWWIWIGTDVFLNPSWDLAVEVAWDRADHDGSLPHNPINDSR